MALLKKTGTPVTRAACSTSRSPMLWHDLTLALASLRRNPVLSGLMIATIAIGIAAAMIATTLYHARTGHPIPWKDRTLYAVAVDPRDIAAPAAFPRHPDYPPYNLTYQDARALYASKIPRHAVMMYRSSLLLAPSKPGLRPFRVAVRVTTADFFAAFDVPFLHGGGWTRTDDDIPTATVVLTRFMSRKLFGDGDSIGREVVLQGRTFRVGGVLDSWMPQPRYYDLGGDGFDIPEDVFIPFGWLQAAQLMPLSYQCVSSRARMTGSESLLTQDCVWLQHWVELRSPADLPRFQAFVDAYTDEQRAHGRFQRPKNNNRIVNVPGLLAMWDVVGDDNRLLLLLGFLFLGVCVLNTLGLLLAKFLGVAPVSALRRALGARRIDIVRAHLTEVVLVAVLGGALGIALTFGALKVLRSLLFSGMLAFSDNPDRVALTHALVHVDGTVLALAVAASVLVGILAGLYPAWRIGRLPPATFLKAP
jgi:putative ABC transport system permease protein